MFGAYIKKDKEKCKKDWEWMCTLAGSSDGPTISTFNKVTNMFFAAMKFWL